VITLTDTVENYPGFKHLTGQEFAQKMEEHARDYDIEIREEKVLEFATGAKWRELTMKGAEEFKSRGVHYCSLCDGALYKDKNVGKK